MAKFEGMHIGNAYAYEQLTVTNAVKTGTATVYKTQNSVTGPVGAMVSVETDAIRYTLDGTTPSAATGHKAAVGDVITVVGGNNVANLKMFRVTTDATVCITYFRGSHT